MKTIHRIAWTACFLLAVLRLPAQSGKVDEALEGFKKTSFMVQFLDLRTQMETTARGFRKMLEQDGEGRFKPQDAQRVITGYEQSASRANAILQGVVSDFLQQKKMRFIARFPETYAKGLELDLRNLSDFSVQNFHQPLADLTAAEV
ncbi:MAG: hypothetical protein AAB316_08040, partial [Bacteroidota bacterium]